MCISFEEIVKVRKDKVKKTKDETREKDAL